MQIIPLIVGKWKAIYSTDTPGRLDKYRIEVKTGKKFFVCVKYCNIKHISFYEINDDDIPRMEDIKWVGDNNECLKEFIKWINVNNWI